MTRTFQITINLTRLRENLSAQEGRALSDAEVLQWLQEAGFRRLNDDWQVSEPDLGQLEPDEVNTALIVGEPDEPAEAG